MPPIQNGSVPKSPDLDEISIIIRSVLTAFKDGCSVDVLAKEYRENCGANLPVRDLGYHSALDLLKDLPHVARFSNNKFGEMVVCAVSTQDTRHVAELVRRQKSAPRKSARPQYGKKYGIRNTYSNRPSIHRAKHTKAAHSDHHTKAAHSDHHTKAAHSDHHTKAAHSDHHTKAAHFDHHTRNEQNYRLDENYPQSFSNVRNDNQRKAPSVQSRMTSQFQSASTNADATFPSLLMSRQIQSANRHIAKNFELQPSRDYEVNIVRRLEMLAGEHSLGAPVYKSLPMPRGNAYMCSVRVGDYSAGSIEEFPSLEEAKCEAASNLFKLLNQYYTKTNERNCGTASAEFLETTIPFEKMVENILILLEDYPTGVLCHTLAKKYAEKFGEVLSADWLLDVEKNAPEITLDKIDNSHIIVAKTVFQSPQFLMKNKMFTVHTEKFTFDKKEVNKSYNDEYECSEDQYDGLAGGDELPSTSFFTNIVGLDDKFLRKELPHNATVADVPKHEDFEASQLNNICTTFSQLVVSDESQFISVVDDLTDLPVLSEFDDEFEVVVVFAADPSEFCVQPMSYVVELDLLNKSMMDFYSTTKLDLETMMDLHNSTNFDFNDGPNGVKIDGYYAALIRGIWFRVYCADNTCSNTIFVYLVDYGEFMTCESTDILPLALRFRQLPMLSIKCSLSGIQPFDKFAHSYDMDCSIYFGYLITNKTFKAVINQKCTRKSFNKRLLPHLSIDLVDLTTGEHVTDVLIQQGYAVKV